MIVIKSVLIYSTLFVFLMIILLLYILGGVHFVTDFEDNSCDMTYMFEYPQYVRISLDNEIEETYPRFALYAYGEGFVTEKLRRMHFSGIPVLFIPGNAGSHEQVRSLASVSLRKSLKDRTPFHFDYFTVSLGKDYSALYGGVLIEETLYVSHCIQKILSLYKGNMENVVLIGHSMGGVVGKGAIVLTPHANASMVSIIINLATPNTPNLVLDSTIANYYQLLHSHSNRIKDADISVVSIGGGPRDILVTSAQTIDPSADINVLSTSIPDVWKSTDHLSILWCKQLVLSVVRSLFDSVNYNQRYPQIHLNSENRMQALSYHFLHRAAGKRLYIYKDKVKFGSGGEWIEDIRQQYVWINKNTARRTSSVYLMIRLNEELDHLTIDTINLETKDWLFVCSATKVEGYSRTCEWGWNLTNRTRILPDPLHRLRKVVDLNMEQIKYPGVTHIIVRIAPDDLDKYVTVMVDRYTYNERLIPIRGSSTFLGPLFHKPKIINSRIGSIRYYGQFINPIDVTSVELKASECTDSKHHAVVELLESDSIGPTQIQFFTVVDNGPKAMKMQMGHGRFNTSSNLRITLDPECSYIIHIQEGGIIDRMSCIVRDRWPLLYTTIISLLLLIISIRIDHGREKVPTVIITIFFAIYYGIVLECCIALAIFTVFTIGLCFSIIFLGSVAHSIAVRFLARAITFSTTWSEWLLGGLNQIPFITEILVFSIIPATCGALAMLISVFLYFLNLTKMYEDYLEELLMASLQHFKWVGRFRSHANNENTNKEDTRQKIFNHLIMFLLWCFTALPAIPSVLVWAKNFSYNMRLSTEDPFLSISWVILVGCTTLGGIEIPSKHLGIRTEVLANTLRLISWIVLSLAATSQLVFYQCYIPLAVAIANSFIVLNNLIPSNIFH